MLIPLLITFRETIEATLVIGIILTFLTKTNQNIFKKYVWLGIAIGILLSLLIAITLNTISGGFQGKSEPLFEGILMFITAAFITWMIMWVHKAKNIAKKIKNKITQHIEKGYGIGIIILVASSIFREGTETVLYLKASSIMNQSNQLTGAIIGIAAALITTYALFRWALQVKLSLVFNATSIFLILFAAGLISNGIHEFQEINILPIFSFDPIFNISHIINHESILGSLLRTLFGYTSKPTLLEIFSYATYIIFILWFQKVTDKDQRA